MSRNKQDIGGLCLITKFELFSLNFVLTCHGHKLLFSYKMKLVSTLGKQQYVTTEISKNFFWWEKTTGYS